MSGYSRIFFDNTYLWVRFERVGHGGRFDILLDDFRATFPLATWDQRRGAWQLSVNQLQKVKQFCENKLGRGTVKLQTDDNTSSSSGQLAFL